MSVCLLSRDGGNGGAIAPLIFLKIGRKVAISTTNISRLVPNALPNILHLPQSLYPNHESKHYHSALMRNLMKVWKTWTGPSRGGRAWSRGPKSALSKILQNKEHLLI